VPARRKSPPRTAAPLRQKNQKNPRKTSTRPVISSHSRRFGEELPPPIDGFTVSERRATTAALREPASSTLHAAAYRLRRRVGSGL